MGLVVALRNASLKFDMWMGIDDQTLIQICSKTNDTECIEGCLKKIVNGQGSLNLDTLKYLISSNEIELIKDVLTKFQI